MHKNLHFSEKKKLKSVEISLVLHMKNMFRSKQYCIVILHLISILEGVASGSLLMNLVQPQGHLTSNLITKKGIYFTSLLDGEFLTIGTFFYASYLNNNKEKRGYLPGKHNS